MKIELSETEVEYLQGLCNSATLLLKLKGKEEDSTKIYNDLRMLEVIEEKCYKALKRLEKRKIKENEKYYEQTRISK